MLPRSSLWRRPNFHVGTGHLMAPEPMAFPALSPRLAVLLPNEFPFDHMPRTLAEVARPVAHER